MKATRYTESQILCGLREAWPVFSMSCHPIKADMPVVPKEDVDQWVEDVDLDDVIHRLEGFFCFTASREEWFELFGCNPEISNYETWKRDFFPQLTFGRLARFIAERAPVAASFDPISVLGKPCETAGIFMGVRRVAQIAGRNRMKFPPSARIFDVLRGRDLHTFWLHLSWMTEDALPGLPWFWCSITQMVVGMGCLTLAVAYVIAFYNALLLMALLLVVPVCYLTARAYKYYANPLPWNIVTFRDLSMVIADSRHARRESAMQM